MRAAQPGDVPTSLTAEYYAQRASPGGLIIAEASQISLEGKGYPQTPGIFTAEQVAGWRQVTDAVHAKGGFIFLQLWHVGRIAHSSINAVGPVGASPVRTASKVFTSRWEMVPAEVPRELAGEDIARILADYARAAQNAMRAGFDGVELHGANGYLADQFLQTKTNLRADHYGGSIENRARFLLEATQQLIDVWGADRVGVRLSPYGVVNDIADSEPLILFNHVLQSLSRLRIVYAHLIEPRSAAGVRESGNVEAPEAAATFRSSFNGVMIVSGGFSRESARAVVDDGRADAVAFGRAFIANPDLPARLRLGAPLNPYVRDTFYGGDARGYTDYPSLPSTLDATPQ
jgi:N-ethylmaleimide reductase